MTVGTRMSSAAGERLQFQASGLSWCKCKPKKPPKDLCRQFFNPVLTIYSTTLIIWHTSALCYYAGGGVV